MSLTKDLFYSRIVSTSGGCKEINVRQSCLPQFAEKLNKITS